MLYDSCHMQAHARIPYLHLKSVDPEMQTKVKRERTPFAKAVEIDMSCEPSKAQWTLRHLERYSERSISMDAG